MDCESAVDRMIAEGVRLGPGDLDRRDGLMTLVGALHYAVEQSVVLPDDLLDGIDELVLRIAARVPHDMSGPVSRVAQLRSIARVKQRSA